MTTKTTRMSPKEHKKLRKAEKDYQKMWATIRPFYKKRVRKHPSTAGKWVASSSD